jgi:hypothetical protein
MFCIAGHQRNSSRELQLLGWHLFGKRMGKRHRREQRKLLQHHPAFLFIGSNIGERLPHPQITSVLGRQGTQYRTGTLGLPTLHSAAGRFEQ